MPILLRYILHEGALTEYQGAPEIEDAIGIKLLVSYGVHCLWPFVMGNVVNGRHSY